MSTVTAFIRTTKKGRMVNVRFRVRDGRNIQLFHKSEIKVDPEKWDSKKECYKSKVIMSDNDRTSLNVAVSDRKNLIDKIYTANKEGITTEKLNQLINESLDPKKYKSPDKSFFSSFEKFAMQNKFTTDRRNLFLSLMRTIQRYEAYKTIETKQKVNIDFEYFNTTTMYDFDSFLRDEHLIYNEHKQLYKTNKLVTQKPKQRGSNTINHTMKNLRSFFIWALDNNLTSNDPFKNFKIPDEVYGTPIYINIEERNKIYNTDLSEFPALAAQRDVFVFQCLIGCRYSDLIKLKYDNIIDGFLEYIPNKTKESRGTTIRVPLNGTAKEIIERYRYIYCRGKLLPFITKHRYNDAIKKAFKYAGVTRMVTVLNPVTRHEERKPINEVASSHMARRTFVGNIYKKVKDPNLVGALSGHKEGSKAFARYRDIDDDMRLDIIKHLD